MSAAVACAPELSVLLVTAADGEQVGVEWVSFQAEGAAGTAA